MHRTYFCSILGEENSGQSITARSRGQAKVEYWRDVRDWWPDCPYTRISARVSDRGRAELAKRVAYTANLRGRPEIKLDAKCMVFGKERGVVIDSDASANFVIMFDSGRKGHVHPSDIEIL